MRLRQVHDGGFLWPVDRADRDECLRELYLSVGRFVAVANSESSARALAERLVLSGLPVLVATNADDVHALHDFEDDRRSALVTTDAFLHAHSGLAASLVVYMRVAEGARALKRRRAAVDAAVQLTFVVPEDVRRAEQLASHLERELDDQPVVDLTGDDAVSAVVDLTAGTSHERPHRRRRFPLAR